MWSKKWYLKRSISCDAHLLNELLVMDVPWDNVIMLSAGKLRKLWDSFVQFCVWKTAVKDSSEACAIACQNCAVCSFSVRYDVTQKIAQFNWECIGRLRLSAYHFFYLPCRYSILNPNRLDAFRSLPGTSQTIMMKHCRRQGSDDVAVHWQRFKRLWHRCLFKSEYSFSSN
jgi:hypothetical protein